MTYSNLKAKAYQQTSARSAEYTDPYSVIGMLLQNCITRLFSARNAFERKDYATKGMESTKAIDILHALRDTLDHERGGEIAENLDSLYLYMAEKVLEASVQLDVEKLDHVARLMQEVKAGWDGIREQAVSMPQAPAAEADTGGGLSVRG